MTGPKNGILFGCISPPELSDDSLFAALDGDVDPTVQEHLAKCAYCSDRLEKMRWAEETLNKVMYRASCPPAAHLADYVTGTFTIHNQTQINQHLQTCVLCRREVHNLQAIFVMDGGRIVPEPIQEPILQRVRAIFQAIENQFIRLLTPQPRLDYGQLKGIGDPNGRVLSFGHGSVSVMLSLEKGLDGLKINGSIIDTEGQTKWNKGYVELISQHEGTKRFTAIIDEDDMFTFDSIIPGRFNLSVYAIDGQILRLEDVEIML